MRRFSVISSTLIVTGSVTEILHCASIPHIKWTQASKINIILHFKNAIVQTAFNLLCCVTR